MNAYIHLHRLYAEVKHLGVLPLELLVALAWAIWLARGVTSASLSGAVINSTDDSGTGDSHLLVQ